jgi:hypothetical protein
MASAEALQSERDRLKTQREQIQLAWDQSVGYYAKPLFDILRRVRRRVPILHATFGSTRLLLLDQCKNSAAHARRVSRRSRRRSFPATRDGWLAAVRCKARWTRWFHCRRRKCQSDHLIAPQWTQALPISRQE